MRSMRRELTRTIGIGSLLVLIVAGVIVYLTTSRALRNELDATLEARAHVFASMTVDELADEDDEGGLSFEYGGSLSEEDLGVFVRIASTTGELIGASDNWPGGSPESAHEPDVEVSFWDVALESGVRARGVRITTFALRDEDEILLARAATPAGEPMNESLLSNIPIVVEVVGRTDGVESAEAAVLTALLLGLGIATLGTCAVVWISIRRGFGPLDQMKRALERADERAPRLDAESVAVGGSIEELAPMVRALSELLNRLRSAMERERRFTDAAAHELRTPLAEVRTLVDVAERFPEPERLHRNVREIGQVIEEVEALLASLLAVARGERLHIASEEGEGIAVLPVARTLVEDQSERLKARGIACEIDGDADVSLPGPRGAITAVVRNLIDNASEYTPDGGRIRIGAYNDLEGVRFEVENGPVSIDDNDVPLLFEPFWRHDSARTGGKHRGLGLSIVSSLCTTLGVTYDAAMTADRHLRIGLRAIEA